MALPAPVALTGKVIGFTARSTVTVAKVGVGLVRDLLDRGGDQHDTRWDVATPAPTEAPETPPTRATEPTTGRTSDQASEESAAPEGATGRSLELPIEDYDALTADQVVARLGDLDAVQLAAVEGYERAGRARRRVLDRVSALRRRRTDEELEEVVSAEPTDVGT
jgi:hypothetical protein